MENEASEKKNRKRKIVWGAVALGIGLAVAMIVMMIAIYFGYSSAYRVGTDSYSVSIFGLEIYELSKVNEAYIGASKGINMGIFCMICMAVAIVVEQIVVRVRRR